MSFLLVRFLIAFAFALPFEFSLPDSSKAPPGSTAASGAQFTLPADLSPPPWDIPLFVEEETREQFKKLIFLVEFALISTGPVPFLSAASSVSCNVPAFSKYDYWLGRSPPVHS